MEMSEIFYVFDVDGTVTDSRQVIDKEFAEYFEKFATLFNVILVTGSDRPKTVEQLGHIYDLALRVYNCSGNDVYERSNNVRKVDFKISPELEQFLEAKLLKSDYPIRAGGHLDVRSGNANFSVVGRHIDWDGRLQYHLYDSECNERKLIAAEINAKFPDYQASIAGEIGIDIMYKGDGKHTILKDFKDNDNVYFFGDSCQEGGNDYSIAQAVLMRGEYGRVYSVRGWKETWEILKSLV